MAAGKYFDVFLSHNSVDKPWVVALKDALVKRGLKVWLDKDEVKPGDRFAEALEAGIRSARSVALIASPESVSSGWVREEYYSALNLAQEGRLRLIPVILRDAALPEFLKSRSWVDFRDNSKFEQSLELLISGINAENNHEITAMEPFPSLQISDPMMPSLVADYQTRPALSTKVIQAMTKGQSRFPVLALIGMGGSGKTQLAREFVEQSRNHFDLIWWVNAVSTEALTADFQRMCSRLKIDAPSGPIKAVVEWLASHPRCLIVFDDLASIELFHETFSATSPCSCLVTTRNSQVATVLPALEVNGFTSDETNAFLSKNLAEQTGFDAISRLCAGSPLALKQASTFMQNTLCSPADFLRRFRERGLDAFSPPLKTFNADYTQGSVQRMIEMSISEAEARHALALPILKLLSLLGSYPVPRKLLDVERSRTRLRAIGRTDRAEVTEHDVAAAVAALRTVSLLEAIGFSNLQLHPLVRTHLRNSWSDLDRNFELTMLAESTGSVLTEIMAESGEMAGVSVLPHILDIVRSVDLEKPDLLIQIFRVANVNLAITATILSGLLKRARELSEKAGSWEVTRDIWMQQLRCDATMDALVKSKQHYTNRLGTFAARLAENCHAPEEANEARRLVRRSLRLARDPKSKASLSMALDNAVDAYLSLGDLKRALDLKSEVLSQFKKETDKDKRLSLNLTVRKLWLREQKKANKFGKKQQKDLERLTNDALSLTSDPKLQAFVLRDAGQTALGCGNKALAAKYLKLALTAVRRRQIDPNIVLCLELDLFKSETPSLSARKRLIKAIDSFRSSEHPVSIEYVRALHWLMQDLWNNSRPNGNVDENLTQEAVHAEIESAECILKIPRNYVSDMLGIYHSMQNVLTGYPNATLAAFFDRLTLQAKEYVERYGYDWNSFLKGSLNSR